MHPDSTIPSPYPECVAQNFMFLVTFIFFFFIIQSFDGFFYSVMFIHSLDRLGLKIILKVSGKQARSEF